MIAMRKRKLKKLIYGTTAVALAFCFPLETHASDGSASMPSSPQADSSNVDSSKNRPKASQKAEEKTPRKHPQDKLLDEIYTQLVAYRPDQALRCASKLVRSIASKDLRDPKTRLHLSRALLWVGCAFQMDENLAAARSAYLTAHELVPKDLAATCYLANCERELHHYDAEHALLDSLYQSIPTRTECELLVDKDPSKPPRFKKISSDELIGPDHLGTRPPLWKNDTEAILELKMLARSARRKINLDVAMAHFEEAEQHDVTKSDTSLQILIAQTSVLAGLGEPAAKRFERAAAITENPYIKEILLADAASLRMDQAAQEKYILNASKIYPYDPIWRVKLANLYHGAGRSAEARLLLEEAIACKRLSSNAYISLAMLLSGAEKYDEALRVLDRLQSLIEPSAAVAAAKADVYWAKKDAEKALKLYDEALKINDQYARPYENAANIYVTLKKNNDALKVMSACAKTIPRYWRGHLNFGSTLNTAGKLEDAVKECETGLDLLPQPESDLNVLAKHHAAKGHAIIGYFHYKNKRWDEALKEAKEFNRLKFNPDLPPLLKVVNIRPGRLMFTEELGLKDPMSRAALGDMLLELNDLSASEREYRKAVELLPDNRDLHGYLLHVLTQKGDWGEATKENLVLSSKIVNEIPKQVSGWGSKKNDSSDKE